MKLKTILIWAYKHLSPAVMLEVRAPSTYSGVYLNRYDESVVKDKRSRGNDSTYSGVFFNMYQENAEKDKRDPTSESTYSGIYLNRYEGIGERLWPLCAHTQAQENSQIFETAK